MTVVFGLSRNLALSLAALVLVGACDMVSVIVRHTLIQLRTPDEMRGRVSAVNMVFLSASNEVGQFESGPYGAMVRNRAGGGGGRLGHHPGGAALGQAVPRAAPGRPVDRRGINVAPTRAPFADILVA